MKKWLAVLAGVVAITTLASPAEAHRDRGTEVEVLSQNLYIGADLSRLLAGESPADVLATTQATNFPARSVEIAEAIDDFNPDLIALQEVTTISVFDTAGNVALELDYLDILMASLAAQGESYAVASSVTNADITLPIDPVAGTFGRVVDRDVILYRTATTTVANPTSANYDVNFTVPFGPTTVTFTRGYTGVDATVGDYSFRFVNTHLEVEDAPCMTAAGPVICQEVQAAQLIEELADGPLPTILTGDFNAVPGATAYDTIDNAGYLDTWTVRYPYNDEPGYTCCQAEYLLNVENQLSQRIDHIFIEDDVDLRKAVTTVVGDWEERKTADGLWYSDHGGPYARLTIR